MKHKRSFLLLLVALSISGLAEAQQEKKPVAAKDEIKTAPVLTIPEPQPLKQATPAVAVETPSPLKKEENKDDAKMTNPAVKPLEAKPIKDTEPVIISPVLKNH